MKKLISLMVCFCFVICLFFVNMTDAYADPFTAAQIGTVAYAAMSSWGLQFTAENATTLGMSDFMGSQITEYVNHKGGSIASVFGSDLAVNVAGKLAAGYQMYNALVDFAGWMGDKYNLSAANEFLTNGFYNGEPIPKSGIFTPPSSVPSTGIYIQFSGSAKNSTYMNVSSWVDGVRTAYTNYADPTIMGFTGEYKLSYDGAILVCYAPRGTSYVQRLNVATRNQNFTNSLSVDGTDYTAPTVIDPSYQWLGQVGDYQDTNLDQLLQHILEDVEGNTLDVVGELSPIDPPQPSPTPVPIDPDMPLQDVPWEGLDNNLQQLYEQGLEEIGTIGDARDGIIGAIGEQTDELEGAIADNAGVVSGSIDQAVSDVQTAIGEQTAALDESLSATAEGVETIAEAIEDETINWRKFDLKGLFPFCIPFDIYNMLNALDASPVAPHVQIPFVIQSLGFSYLIDLDFSAFDPVAAIMRQMELICYGLALAWATSKVIKW